MLFPSNSCDSTSNYLENNIRILFFISIRQHLTVFLLLQIISYITYVNLLSMTVHLLLKFQMYLTNITYNIQLFTSRYS